MSSNRIRSSSWGTSSTSLISMVEARKYKNRLCRLPKTFQEKLFFCLISFLFIVVVVFIISLWIIGDRWKSSLSQMKHIYVEEDHVCETEACMETAEKIIENLDPSTNPCVDFYQYACGGWMEKNPIPEGKVKVDTYGIHIKEVRRRVVDLIKVTSKEVEKPKSLSLIGKVYDACMNEENPVNAIKQWERNERNKLLHFNDTEAVTVYINEETREKNGLSSLKKLLTQFGGWIMLDNAQLEEDYVWYKHLAEVNRKLYLKNIFDISFRPNLRDNTRYTIHLREGECMFEDVWSLGDEEEIKNSTEPMIEYIVNSALLLNSTLDATTLRKMALEMIKFESMIHDAVLKEIGMGIYSANFSTLNSLGNDTISYMDFVNFHFPDDAQVDESTYAYVLSPMYYETGLPEVILKTEKRTIANYIAFSIVHYFSSYASKDIRDLWDTFQVALGMERNVSAERMCISNIRIFMPDAVGRLYVDNYFPELTRIHITKMVQMIRLAYSSTLDQNTWMDKNTLLYALVKLQSIEQIIGNSVWITDDDRLDEYYKKTYLINEDNFLDMMVSLNEIMSDRSFSKWNKTVVRSEMYDVLPIFVVNAFYASQANLMSLPAGIFGYPFYKYGRIDSINFGAIGSVIGHELSHAFDDDGSNFDHKGNLRNWWTESTKEKFLEKATCFAKQYEDAVNDWLPFKMDGNETLGENIADNGAIRNTFKAFKLHLALSDEDISNRKRLPGLSASPEQLFFLGYASVWCANMTDEYAKSYGTDDEHSHPKLRVNVPLANFKEFARAFKCDSGTPMNPKDKCVLW